MNTIDSVDQLKAIYGLPSERSLNKVSSVITPLYNQWIGASRFLVIATVGDEGCDASPRGDIENLVKIPDSKTMWVPDWKGNNRLDTISNIVRDGRLSLLFMVSGCGNVVRVNGKAVVTNDNEIVKTFSREGKTPATVIVVSVGEVYFQCAKALMRSDLWNPETGVKNLPTAGQFANEMDADFDAQAYDESYSEYSKSKMW